MDRTVTEIASVVVAELRAAGYSELTIGQYEKTIRALRLFAAGVLPPPAPARQPDGRSPLCYDSCYDRSMTRCTRCGTEFAPSGRRRYCSDACKQADWRDRKAPAQLGPDRTSTARPVRAEHTVYECPSCETRYLGVRRCEECNLFCRRIGPGGLCPHCDEPVAHDDLA